MVVETLKLLDKKGVRGFATLFHFTCKTNVYEFWINNHPVVTSRNKWGHFMSPYSVSVYKTGTLVGCWRATMAANSVANAAWSKSESLVLDALKKEQKSLEASLVGSPGPRSG